MTVFNPYIIHPFAPNHLGYSGLDRDDAARADDHLIDQLITQPETRIMPVWHSANYFAPAADDNAPPEMGCLSGGDQDAGMGLRCCELADTLIYLGRDRDGHAYIAADISTLSEDARDALGLPGYFADLREVSPLIDGYEGSILGYARALCFWHQRHQFCSVCGHATFIAHSGHVRKCSHADCAAPHFPRTDAAIIVKVTYQDRILMGRQPVWPEGMMSVLAGFVEPGETLEHAVAREVFEEAGIRVKDVRYQHSQPWPFPASLMLGFTAIAEHDQLNVNYNEIEHAGWYTRQDIANFSDMGLFLPRKLSIARRLIDKWLAQDT